MENTQEYIDFILSDEFLRISRYTDYQISECKYDFIDKIFPVTDNMENSSRFIIDIVKLRNSQHFQIVKDSMIISLQIFCRFFRILETGMEEYYLTELVKFKLKIARIVRSLMYHELYVNAQLLCFRLIRFRLNFSDIKRPTSIWEMVYYSSITEIESHGIEYREPSISGNY